MPYHEWGDKWFEKNGNDLGEAINYIMSGWIRWGRIGTHGKEKYGSFRDHPYFYRGYWPVHELIKPGHVWYRWPRFFMHIEIFLGKHIVQRFYLYIPIQWYQSKVYNYFIQQACKKWPEIVDEIVADLDAYQLVKPGIFGKICGDEVNRKYWTTVE